MIQFSIIIPTHNASRDLSKALDSVLAQTWGNYEIIIVDGGSTDGTQKIIQSYQDNFQGKLSCISEKDSGIYDAMNKGIGVSSGEWIYFLGSDDSFYNPFVLEQVSSHIENNKACSIVYGDVMLGRSRWRIYGGEFTKEKLIEKNIAHQSIFLKKDIFTTLGIYDTRYTIFADWIYNIKWFNSSIIKYTYMPVIVARYGLHGRSRVVFDHQFYKDIEDVIKLYFPLEYHTLFEKIRGPEIRFITNKFRWKMWEWRKKILFVFQTPKDFIQKYFF